MQTLILPPLGDCQQRKVSKLPLMISDHDDMLKGTDMMTVSMLGVISCVSVDPDLRPKRPHTRRLTMLSSLSGA
jgi:hypothetical protein